MKSLYDFELVNDKKPKAAVLLFHGMTGSPFELKKYAKFLYNKGYDVFGYCLAGHGDHPITIYEVKWQDWAQNAQEKFNVLKNKYQDVFLGGLCLGSVLALYTAQNNKDVKGVLALSTTLFLDGWTIPEYNFLFPVALNTIIRYLYTFPEREPYGIKNERTRAKIVKLMGKNTVAMDHYPLTCVHELLRLSKVARKNMKKIDCPILLFHSLKDDLTSIKSSRFVYKNIKSTDKKLIELKDSYHLILYDNEKEEVFEKSFDFLAKISPLQESEFLCGI